jgi:hypothetical protein
MAHSQNGLWLALVFATQTPEAEKEENSLPLILKIII